MANTRRHRWSDYLVWFLVTCACIVILLVVHRLIDQRFGWPIGAKPEAQAFVTEWRAIAEAGRDGASSDAEVTMIVFTDFQCPHCRPFAKAISGVREHYGRELTVALRHYPLPIHSEAENAAAASECARQLGRFWDYHDILFEDHDAIGSRAWSEFATAAGVDDVAAFERCISVDSVRVAVRRDVVLAADIGVTGTPTFILNGSLYRGAMPESSLRRAIEWHMRNGGIR